MDTGTIILILGFLAPVIAVIIIILGMKRSFIKRAQWAADLREKQMHAMPFNAKVIKSEQGVTGGDIKRIIYFTLNQRIPAKPTRQRPHGLWIH
jgi:hypothetical protein